MSVTVIFFPSNTHLEVQSHGVPFSISWGVSTLFPIVDVGVYITNKSAQGSLFWTTLSTLTSCLFDNSYSNRYDVLSHCGLICISLLISDVEHVFMYLLAIYISFLEKCSGLLPIFKSCSILANWQQSFNM